MYLNHVFLMPHNQFLNTNYAFPLFGGIHNLYFLEIQRENKKNTIYGVDLFLDRLLGHLDSSVKYKLTQLTVYNIDYVSKPCIFDAAKPIFEYKLCFPPFWGNA